LKVEVLGFTDRLNLGCERRKRKEDAATLDLRNQKFDEADIF
jgi:hypothetical protein